MPKYIAHVKTWLGHENRMVLPGEVFETTFPEGMKLSGNIESLEPEKPTRTTRRNKTVEAEQLGDEGQTDPLDTDNTDDTPTPNPNTETDEA
jgi:hypothetical protein